LHKALIVEDNPECLDGYLDAMDSLGHRYDLADCQQKARDMLAENEYTYVLLDLEIPFEPGRMPRRENGENLFEQIVACDSPDTPLVIITTSHGKGDNEWAADLVAAGAANFINKDFPKFGRTLDSVVKKALVRRRGRRRAVSPSNVERPAGKSRRFSGGEMLFGVDCIRLCGVKIITDKGTGQSMMILDELRQQDSQGRFVPRCAEELATAIDAPGGVGTISSCIGLLRRNIIKRLQRELGIKCELEDVIARDEQGYYLREWITVVDADEDAISQAGFEGCKANVSGKGTPTVRLNRRQKWALAEIQRGVRLQRKMLEERFRVTAKTAKRDFAELREWGRVEFVRSPSPGYYRLER